VARRAGQLAGCEAFALHQPQWLKTQVLKLRIVNGWAIAVAISTEPDLFGSGELAGIEYAPAALSVLGGAGVAADALNTWHHGLQVAGDCGGMATDARLQIARTLPATERGHGVGGCSGILAYRDSILVKLRKVTQTRFKPAVRGLNQGRLPLRSGAQDPLDQSGRLVGAMLSRHFDTSESLFEREFVSVVRLNQRLRRQILRERALEGG
jgi:hypothetical protein